MFGGGSIEIDGETAMAAVREADWKALHRRLRGLAKQRIALEAEEASCLVEPRSHGCIAGSATPR